MVGTGEDPCFEEEELLASACFEAHSSSSSKSGPFTSLEAAEMK